MRQIPLYDHAGGTTTEREAIERLVQPLQTLADVLAWVRTRGPRAKVAEIVTQDEYTHDVVVESPGRPYLAFDTT
jgi:hypothetical protein